eukprot:XP_012810772.1 PREDICTED: CMRF35-like molecule 8 [Xenopus tropicalis]
MKQLLLWGSFCLAGVWSLSGPSQLEVRYGEALTVTCGYYHDYWDYNKYLCRGEGRSSCNILIMSEGPRKVTNGRLTIEDNRTLSSFTVTMAAMKPQDSDIYQCGIEFTGKDGMHPIRVTVLPGICRATDPWGQMVDFPENFLFVEEKNHVTVSCREQFVEKTLRLECRQAANGFLLFSPSDETPCVEKCQRPEPWGPDVALSPEQEYYGPDEWVKVSCPPGYEPNSPIIQCIKQQNTSGWNVTEVSCEPLPPPQSIHLAELNLTSVNSTGTSCWSFSWASLTFGLLPGIFLKLLISISVGGRLLCNMSRTGSAAEQGARGKGESDGAVSNEYRQVSAF